MAFNPYPPLPVGALRDLLGIARALERVAREEETHDESRLEALASVGKNLEKALEGSGAHAGTIPYQTAWGIAERATAELVGIVAGTAFEPLVAATAVLVRRRSSMR